MSEPTWTLSLQSLVTVGGFIAQAAITWWRVKTLELEMQNAKARLLELDLAMDGLREWRAETRQWMRDRGISKSSEE